MMINTKMRGDKFKTRLAILLAFIMSLALPLPALGATCTSIASCTSEQQRLKQQQQEATQNFDKNKREAQNLQEVISDLQGDINYAQNRINNAEDQIKVTDEILNQLAVSIDTNQAKLSNAYISLYELSRTNNTQLIFSANLNDRLSQAQYIQSIQSQLQKDIEGLQQSQSERESQKGSLEDMKRQLEEERASLASKKSRQSYLLSVAQSNASYYQNLSADIQKKVADIERQINTLVARQSWGSDIVSVNDGSWYFRQLDYPNVRLGNSPYTVAQYGCLITSYAMVSTFYGNRVTPVDIANNVNNFNDQGYLTKQPPLPVTLSSVSTSPVNWATVNAEIDAGRPLLVSIYIPDVGVINADGSSHFVVLYGRSGNKYYMQDPLGPGRSYAAKYVKSMKIIRK